jgi:hypothetical protein
LSVYELFSFRFPKRAKNWDLYNHLDRIANGKDPMVLKVPNPMRRIIRKLPAGPFLRCIDKWGI